MYEYPDSLILFAAGNDGSQGWNSVVSPSTNKNGISCGAGLNDQNSFMENEGDFEKSIMQKSSPQTQILPFYEGETLISVNELAYFSSRGPTADGRLKPDIIGPGW